MSRRQLLRAGLALTSLALLSACGVPLPGAQQAAKVHRIGYLSTQSQAVDSPHFEAFRLGLRDLGYVEGETIALEYRYADGDLERLSDLVAELVRLNVDVIVTGGAPGSRAARQATSTIPLVMTVVGDPIQAGLVASLAKPGGNITGLTQVSPQLSGKRLELLQEALPRISLLAVLVDGGLLAQGISAPLQETKVAAGALGIKLHALEVGGPNLDLDGAFRTATSQGAGALIVLPGPVLELHRERIVDLAAKSGLPAIYSRSEYVEAGGLMAYGPDFIDLYRRAATYVDKILKGRQPADLPVEQPTKFELVINLKTAEQMGLTIPPSVLARADRVIR